MIQIIHVSLGIVRGGIWSDETMTMTDDYSKCLSQKLCGQGQDEPDGKSGEVLQAVQTILAIAGYSNSQQKVHLGQRPKNDGTSKTLI